MMLRAVATTPKITYTQTHIYTHVPVSHSHLHLPPIMSLSPSFPRDTLPCEQVFIFVRLCCWSSLSLSFEKRLFFYINKGITILCVFASRAHAMIYYVCSTCRLNDFLYFCFFFFFYYYYIINIIIFIIFNFIDRPDFLLPVPECQWLFTFVRVDDNNAFDLLLHCSCWTVQAVVSNA